MTDWKTQLEKKIYDSGEAERQKQRKISEARDAENNIQMKLEAERNSQKQKGIFCHIEGCKVISSGPKYYPPTSYGTSEGGNVTSYDASYNWDASKNLIRCKLCLNWTCPDHLHIEYCKQCWELYTKDLHKITTCYDTDPVRWNTIDRLQPLIPYLNKEEYDRHQPKKPWWKRIW